jgi:hypothetical protein
MVALTITVKIIKKMHERVIKSFMDTIIMAELQNGPISGYDAVTELITSDISFFRFFLVVQFFHILLFYLISNFQTNS